MIKQLFVIILYIVEPQGQPTVQIEITDNKEYCEEKALAYRTEGKHSICQIYKEKQIEI